jgi:hypothetical protein
VTSRADINVVLQVAFLLFRHRNKVSHLALARRRDKGRPGTSLETELCVRDVRSNPYRTVIFIMNLHINQLL